VTISQVRRKEGKPFVIGRKGRKPGGRIKRGKKEKRNFAQTKEKGNKSHIGKGKKRALYKSRHSKWGGP